MLTAVTDSPIAEWLKPLRALAAAIAWAVQHVWKPDAISSDLLAGALFGGLMLFGAIALWWISFRALWRARCRARWRKACRGGDVLRTRNARLRHFTGLAFFFLAGCLPLIVSLFLIFAPEILTLRTLGDALAATMCSVSLVFGLFYAVGGPWMSEVVWRDQRLHYRIAFPFYVAGIVFLFLFAARKFWPYELSPQLADYVVAGTWMLMALAWQTCVLRKRETLGWMLTLPGVTLPAVGAALVYFLGPFAHDRGAAAVIYFALTLLTLAFAFAAAFWSKKAVTA